MTTKQDFPPWSKNLVWLLSSVITCVVSIMLYTGSMRTDIEGLKKDFKHVEEENKSLKDMYLRDITDIKKDVEYVRQKLEAR